MVKPGWTFTKKDIGKTWEYKMDDDNWVKLGVVAKEIMAELEKDRDKPQGEFDFNGHDHKFPHEDEVIGESEYV